MDDRLNAILELRNRSQRFITGEMQFSEFLSALSWYRFDDEMEDENGEWDPERAVKDLSDELQQEYLFYVRWHLAASTKKFANPHWVYGESQEPYGWIDKKAYCKQFVKAFQSLKLSRIG